jgi:hypothetical protein
MMGGEEESIGKPVIEPKGIGSTAVDSNNSDGTVGV